MELHPEMFQLLTTKLNAERQDGSSEGLVTHQKGRNPVFGDVHGFQASGSHHLHLNKILKSNIFLRIVFIIQLFLSPRNDDRLDEYYLQYGHV